MNLRARTGPLIFCLALSSAWGEEASSPSLFDPHRSPLGAKPDWSLLDAYQRTISLEEFQRLLDHNYAASPEAYEEWIDVREDHAQIVLSSADSEERYRLEFSRRPAGRPPVRYWRPRWGLPRLEDSDKPLEGVRIGIDPGHIGGDYAKKEGRYFKLGSGKPVMEGAMVLEVAELLKDGLERMGATVLPVRRGPQPVTLKRPADFKDLARDIIRFRGEAPTQLAVGRRADQLFYRASEIRARAGKFNRSLHPDMVLCLHFNAESWGNPVRPSLVRGNHLHVLVNGCCGAGEIALDDVRFEMLLKLLQRCYYEEVAIASKVADGLSAATGLRAFVYGGKNAKPVNANPYVWTRNLLANRVYRCPVVFLEPYVMNNRETYKRVQEGDYPGIREVAGEVRFSIYREYAAGVVAGVVDYYSKRL